MLSDFAKGKQLTLIPLHAEPPDIDEIAVEALEWIMKELEPLMLPGDQVFHYCSEQGDWDRLRGSAGFIIVRDGVIVSGRVYRMN